MKKVIMLLVLFSMAVFAQQKGSFTDPRDGKKYKTVKIGTQTWMAENLNYAAKGSKCGGTKKQQIRECEYESCYDTVGYILTDRNTVNCDKYGRLYGLRTAKNACPNGWHLPSYAEWNMLITAVGGNNVAGKYLKAKSGWYYNGKSGNGEDKFGFSAMPGGIGGNEGYFDLAGFRGFWFGFDDSKDYCNMMGDCGYLSMHHDHAIIMDVIEAQMVSVRCVKDEAGRAEFTDSRDGKKYKTVVIGNQIWMAENLNYDANDSKCYNNNLAYCNMYGRLYNWSTAKSACPKGWHLPTKVEWELLTAVVGGERTACKYLKATSGWNSNGNGEDKFGFAALPGGFGFPNGSFSYVSEAGLFWSASENNAINAYSQGMTDEDDYSKLIDLHKSVLLSVRCLRY